MCSSTMVLRFEGNAALRDEASWRFTVCATSRVRRCAPLGYLTTVTLYEILFNIVYAPVHWPERVVPLCASCSTSLGHDLAWTSQYFIE